MGKGIGAVQQVTFAIAESTIASALSTPTGEQTPLVERAAGACTGRRLPTTQMPLAQHVPAVPGNHYESGGCSNGDGFSARHSSFESRIRLLRAI